MFKTLAIILSAILGLGAKAAETETFDVAPGQTVALPTTYVRTDVELRASVRLGGPLDTIRVGFGKTAYKGGCIEITPDTFGFLETDLLSKDTIAVGRYRYNFGPRTKWSGKPHGLRIGSELEFTLRSHHGYADLTLESEGARVEHRIEKWWEGGEPYFANMSGQPMQVELSFTRLKTDAPVWFYADSYFSTISDQRWPYYMYKEGWDDWMADHIPGGNSPQLLECFKHDLEFGTPSVAVWMLGMNDGRDDNGLDPTYLRCAQEFIAICRDKGIEPVLTTIPTIPERFHDAKTEWVRSSGLRYIDWYEAVGTNSKGEWTPGMLSKDNVHPSESGARALWEAVKSVLQQEAFVRTDNGLTVASNGGIIGDDNGKFSEKDRQESGDPATSHVLSIPMQPGERFYGGGSTSRDHLQHRGEMLRMWTAYQHTEIPVPLMGMPGSVKMAFDVWSEREPKSVKIGGNKAQWAMDGHYLHVEAGDVAADETVDLEIRY